MDYEIIHQRRQYRTGDMQPPITSWRIECAPSVAAQDDTSMTGRQSVSECVLPEIFFNALKRINPQIDPETLAGIVRDYRKYRHRYG